MDDNSRQNKRQQGQSGNQQQGGNQQTSGNMGGSSESQDMSSGSY